MKNSSLLTYSTSVTYTYDSDGIRGTKKVNGIKSTYHYVGGQLRYEERGNTAFYYFYDARGNLSAIRYVDSSNNVYQYYALTNAQGDVIAFYNAAGNCVVTYEYDAWGNVVNTTDDTNINFAELNPIRYRGYYYDSETELYYLQSRYYNPQIGRFLNADDRIVDESTSLELNQFSYCINNPINNFDPTGHSAVALLGLGAIVKSAIVALAPFFAKALIAIGSTVVGVAIYEGVSYAIDKSQAKTKAAEEADTIVRDKVKEDSHDRYWKANKIGGIVTIGETIDYNTAVAEVAAGRNVFTVTKAEAKMVAYAAGGNVEPMHDPKHDVTEPNYYDHYHIHDHANGAHVWYLF